MYITKDTKFIIGYSGFTDFMIYVLKSTMYAYKHDIYKTSKNLKILSFNNAKRIFTKKDIDCFESINNYYPEITCRKTWEKLVIYLKNNKYDGIEIEKNIAIYDMNNIVLEKEFKIHNI